eukprot:4838781-Prymnesium_polylepis.1
MAPNWLADVIGWAFKRLTSMRIHIAATPVMACFNLAYEHFDMAARRAAIAPSVLLPPSGPSAPQRLI